jgi:hypothetical protein
LTSLCLYFDEVHCIPFFPLYESVKGDLRDFQIIIPFAEKGDAFSSFLTETGSLEDEVVFYDRDTIGRVVREENPENEQLWALAESVFKQGNRHMHHVVRSCVIGMLAERKGWIPAGDDPNIPTPLHSAVRPAPEDLPFPGAEECFRLFLPLCRSAVPQDILEAREKLKDELIGFREAMRRLSSMMLTSEDGLSLRDLSQEAEALAGDAVAPAAHELRLKIEQMEDSVRKQAFGSELILNPLIGFAFAIPTPALLGAVLDQDSEHVHLPFLAEQMTGALMRPGFSLLFKMD